MHPQNEASQMLAVLGFPRSGTTLLTALLDAHSQIDLYYEAWNAFPNRPRPDIASNLAEFAATMEKRFNTKPAKRKKITGFKETSTHLEALEWSEAVLAQVSRSTPCHVIWIFRNPVHCFLSRIQGAREWWDNPEAQVDEKSFELFLSNSIPALAKLQEITSRHRGIFVPYDSLVIEPERHLEKLMRELGLPLEKAQFSYHEHVREGGKIMGDPRLQKNPRPVSKDRLEERNSETELHKTMIDEVMSQNRFRSIRDHFEQLSQQREVMRFTGDPEST